MKVLYQAGAFFPHVFLQANISFKKRDDLIVLLKFNDFMTSCVALLSDAMTGVSWMGLILSLERENKANKNGTVWNCPSLGLVSLDWPLQSQQTPSPDHYGLQSPAGLSKSLTCPFLLCDHEFPPGLQKGGWGWNLANFFLILKLCSDKATSDHWGDMDYFPMRPNGGLGKKK